MLWTLVESCAHCSGELCRMVNVDREFKAALEQAYKDNAQHVTFTWHEQDAAIGDGTMRVIDYTQGEDHHGE